jgi:hypothetical protein
MPDAQFYCAGGLPFPALKLTSREILLIWIAILA